MTIIYIVGGCCFAIFMAFIGFVVFAILKRKRKDERDISLRETTGDGNERMSLSSMKDDDFGPNKSDFDKIEERDIQRCKDVPDYQGRKHNKSGKKLNNHDDVLPFDFNRVVLKNLINKTDYVNASWISKAVNERYDSLDFITYPSYSKINFIVTQRPSKKTFPHFYQMVHENMVDLIIALHDKEENASGTNDGIETLGNTTVIMNKRYKIHEQVLKSELELQNKISSSRFSQLINVYEFNQWNKQKLKGNNSMQDRIEQFLQFFCLVRKELNDSKDELTVVVHDAEGGIGAAAIWIALYNLLEQYDENIARSSKERVHINDEMKSLDVSKTVNDLRKQRSKMVNSFANYSFIFECIKYYSHNLGFHFRR